MILLRNHFFLIKQTNRRSMLSLPSLSRSSLHCLDHAVAAPSPNCQPSRDVRYYSEAS